MATGLTNNYNFPYPLQTDPVNIANDVYLLANKIDLDLKEIIEDKSAQMWLSGTFSNGVSTPVYNDISGTMSLSLTQDLRSSATPTFAGAIVSASSSSDGLKITQLGTGNAFLVEDSTSPDSSPFVIDASGNVGVGTSSPTALLEIQDNANTANLIIGGSGSSNVMKIGTPSGDSLAIYADGSEKIRINTTGYIGIGTSSPSTILDVNGTTTTTSLNITSTTLTFNSTTSGSATNDAYIKVERGSDADVFIKWNETTNVWQFTNDGVVYQDIGAGSGGVDTTFFLGGM